MLPSTSRTSFRLQAALATAGLAAALLAACGGGGSDTGTPAASGTATGAAYALGPIDGFGSIVVNGVRFDDTNAQLTDEDGNAVDRSEMKLGAMVQIDAAAVDHAASAAVAHRVRFGPEVVGPASAASASAGTLKVLGQNVVVTSSTVFDDSITGGLAGIADGTVLQVNGLLDTTAGQIVATRIEPKPNAPRYFVRGVVANLTATTFTVGGETINYAGVPRLPTHLANGAVVRALLQTAKVNNAWVATNLLGGLRVPDGAPEAEVEGMITVFTSATSFEINGLKVDATNATFPDGQASLGMSVRVEVSGTVTNGVLVATKVEIKARRGDMKQMRPLELHGAMSDLSTSNKTFALRGVTVWYGGTVTYKNGAETNLANGKNLEVKGVLAADGKRLEAKVIEFK